PSSEPVFVSERLAESCGDDPEVVREILVAFLDSVPPMVSELTTAVSTGDAHLLEHKAHALKGSCRSVGAEALGAVCEQPERMGKTAEMGGAQALMEQVDREFARLRVVVEAAIAA